MSKRLKYAKLRLAKPLNAGDPPPIVTPVKADVCTDGSAVDKTSNFSNKGAKESCTSEETFVLIPPEISGENNEITKEQNSRRRTQKPPNASSNDGPKFPKLRKKTCEGNRLISNFLHSQTNQTMEEDDDFEECKSGPSWQSKQTKVNVATRKKMTKVPKRIKNQSDIRKVFKKFKSDHEVLHELLKEHSASEQIDPEQLQIALAMSRSLVDEQCDQKPTTSRGSPSKDCSAAGGSVSSEERRIVSIRTTLEQFGFRCKNSYTDYDLNVIFGSASTKNVKKIKHKRATNLQSRSKEELDDFIDSQVKKSIHLKTMERKSYVGTLQELRSIQSHLSNHFWIAQTELSSDLLMEKYYVPELLTAQPAPVGCMLKDWNKIPGREKTPERNNDPATGKISFPNEIRVNSPDMFNDSEVINNSTACDTIKEPLLHKVNAEQNGQDCGLENEQKLYSQEVLVSSSSNESSHIKINVASPVSSIAIDTNNIEPIVEQYETNSCHKDQIPVKDERCEMQEEIVVLNDNFEENKGNFNTASDISQCPQLAFHHSSENIFDDTDPNPMVSFEVYSSEEEKIAAASQVRMGMISSNGDIGSAEMALDDSRITNIAKNTSNVMEARFSFERNLSFHRLAIKARLSEALEGKEREIATVDLIENAHDFGKTISNLAEPTVNMPHEKQCAHPNTTGDDVIYISDDEVNYSICSELLRVPTASAIEPVEKKIGTTSKEDHGMAIPYHAAKSTKQMSRPSAKEELESLISYSHDNDNEAIVAEINCAENTFAYLDHLVKEFNLPPLKPSQNMRNGNTDQYVSSETDEKELKNRTTESENHNSPHKVNDEIAAGIIAPQTSLTDNFLSTGIRTSSSKVLSEMKSCTQFEFPRDCLALKSTASDIGFPSSSTSNEREAQNKSIGSSFENKFGELKTVAVNIFATEYVIRTSNVNQKPPTYEDMSTPEIERELFKYGLKALQRSKAIRVLHYLFDEMHPYVMLVERHNIQAKEESSHCKVKYAKKKYSQIPAPYSSAVLTTPRKCAFKLDLNSTTFFLPSKPRKKMAWCAVPLHISFFNLVSESEVLQRQILRFKPINLDEVNGLLKDAGLRYATNDLIAFFDKHCIAFRIAVSNGNRMAQVNNASDA
ncbi:structure-specific endonuclease subunit SLX4 [Anopheles marshallii]|uniref:structure-specific endonuclease subunit SLX4 n=1 Tax=Anopheles marshallii TaxID=1521116 RepID=UPI00237A56B7|nr:structure-specific endonuclease subunit SLX4 [Anopheles marshallii]